jgi:hypothetical protein
MPWALEIDEAILETRTHPHVASDTLNNLGPSCSMRDSTSLAEGRAMIGGRWTIRRRLATALSESDIAATSLTACLLL